MLRLTKQTDEKDIYSVENRCIMPVAGGYSGEVVNQLAKFENLCEELLSRQLSIAAEMENMRAQGKTHSVKFRQLMVNKLTNSNILDLFMIHGLIR